MTSGIDRKPTRPPSDSLRVRLGRGIEISASGWGLLALPAVLLLMALLATWLARA